MQTPIVELQIRADGALSALGRIEDAAEDAGRAVDGVAKAGRNIGQSTGAVDRFTAAMSKMEEATRRGAGITTESVARRTAEQRALERWQSRESALMATQIQLRREAERAAVDMANAVRLGYTSQEQALRTLVNLESQHAAKLADVAGDTARAAAATDSLTAATDRATAATGRLNAANSNVAWRRRNAAYQLTDIGQSLALGAPAHMVAMQQLPQLFQGGIKEGLQDIAGLAAGAARAFGPIAAAAGIAALAIRDIQQEAQKSTSATVTFGDTALAVVQVVRDGIMSTLRPAIDLIGPLFEAAWSWMTDAAKAQINLTIRGITAAINTIQFLAKSIGPAFIVAAEAAANGAIGAFEYMANQIVDAVNWMTQQAIGGFNLLIDGANMVSEALGGGKLAERLNETIGQIGKLDLGRVDMGGAKATEELAAAYDKLKSTLGDVKGFDYWNAFVDSVKDQAVKNALADDADAAKKAGDAIRDAAREYEAFVGIADSLAEKVFPGEYARREAEQLLGLLDRFGSKLDQFQRAAVDARIADLFTASALGLRDLEKDTASATDNMSDMMGEFGRIAAGVFDGAKESVWDWVDAIVEAIGDLPPERVAAFVVIAFKKVKTV